MTAQNKFTEYRMPTFWVGFHMRAFNWHYSASVSPFSWSFYFVNGIRNDLGEPYMLLKIGPLSLESQRCH
jgi:hypothetical protein